MKKYIDAEELLEHIEIVDNYRGYTVENVLQDIKDFPAANVRENVHGEWVKDEMYECDQCHHEMIVGDGAYNFCPNCGADMRGSNDGRTD